MDRLIGKEVIQSTMVKLWKLTSPLSILDIHQNTFIFLFEIEEDMSWVMNCRPWLFESSLLTLKEFNGHTSVLKMDFTNEAFWVHIHDLPIGCMNIKMGTHIGNTIGTIKTCDVNKDSLGWGKALQMLIEMDLRKPISCRRTINVMGNKLWNP